MKAIMLAAGVGERLGGGSKHPPKAILRFGGKSLLGRHVEILRHFGVDELVVAVGYRAELIHDEIAAIGAEDFVRTVLNPDYQKKGPIVTLWSLRAEFDGNDAVIFMDADVLYDDRLMARLLDSPHANCFLLDRDIEPGEDPVKLCIRDGLLVDFHKKLRTPCDYYGEWVGFVRLAPEVAQRVGPATDRYIEAGRTEEIYEEVFRDLLLALPPGTFGFEDITGLPWIEIDFPEDLRRAHDEILPRLKELTR
ncbi:MAG: NTP transferase domain-containing protein [Alphaproteobacteria bacterium]